MRGANESDHNTILVDVEVTKIVKHEPIKATTWNIKASEEKFAEFREKLGKATFKAHSIMNEKDKTISERYASWEKLLYKTAISTIGKTTYKPGKMPDRARLLRR